MSDRMTRITTRLIVRDHTTRSFWERVERRGDTECWLWLGSVDRKGYGRLMPRHAESCKAHRYSYALHRGPIPVNAVILHTCDVPGCVNPAHLRAGSVADNTRDMVSKGRHRRPLKDGICRRGHLLTPDNLIIRPGHEGKRCRICQSAAYRAYRERRKARIAA